MVSLQGKVNAGPASLLSQQNQNASDKRQNGNHDMETSEAQNSQAHDADQDQVNRQQEHSDVLGDIHHLCFGFCPNFACPITCSAFLTIALTAPSTPKPDLGKTPYKAQALTGRTWDIAGNDQFLREWEGMRRLKANCLQLSTNGTSRNGLWCCALPEGAWQTGPLASFGVSILGLIRLKN